MMLTERSRRIWRIKEKRGRKMELQNLYEKAGIDSKVYDFCSQMRGRVKGAFCRD